ncbi:hypothetical protein QDK53_41340, partial [Amycolatopsis magusensis]|nr:hypothetical protein [Amycolatopsis magusensis]
MSVRKLLVTAISVVLLAGVTTPARAEPANAERDILCAVPPDRDIAVTKIVYEIGKGRSVSDKVMLAAFEAGWVESHMNNLPCGDSDSLGVFQQRPSQGWGTVEQIMDVRYATTKFFQVAQQEEPKWPGLSAGRLADKVQRSCCPERYDQAESKARSLLAEAKSLLPGLIDNDLPR